MASIQPHRGKWRVQVYVNGVRESKVADTRKEAASWALSREAELSGKKLPDKTFKDAMERYAREVAPKHRGERWEIVRLTSMAKDSIAKRKLAGLVASDFADWRDLRLADRKPGTVAREMNLMRSVLEAARRDWGWVKVNPMGDVRWPQTPPGRARRVTQYEIDAVAKAFGVGDKLRSETAAQRVGLAFLLAVETAMRSGEMLALTAEDLRLDDRFVILRNSKNGDRREVPLTTRAVKILKALPPTDGAVFGMADTVRDVLWRKHRPAELSDLHFHDSRGEAVWRLSKKLDVLQLARAIGHRDPKSLMHYYRESAADMAKRLD